MKDKHNVILIRVSSKWLIPYSGGSSNSRFHLFHLFFSRSSKLFQVCHHEDPSKSSQGFTLCFQLLFPSLFFSYRSSSWRLYMMVDQGFNFFSKCSLRFFSEEFKHYSSCILKSNSFYLIFWGGVMSLLIIFPSCFMIHKFSRVTYLKSIIFSSFKTSFQSINLFFGIILGYISPKAFPKDCCYLWCL